jgi:hypothetical protein
MSNKVVVSKREIAREFLDAAIEFYLEGTNLICAIHLAGAAEELLGKHLPEDQRTFTFAWKAQKQLMSESGAIVSDMEARKSVTEWKNQIKHMDGGDDATVTFEFGPMAAAEFHIRNALTNFYNLNLPESPAIRKFEDHQSRKYGTMLHDQR